MRHYAVRIPATIVAFLVGLAATNLVHAVYPGATFNEGAEREILSVEREYVRAHVERDIAALERVLADDFTSFRGRVTKEHRLALLANPFYHVTALKTEGVILNVRGDEAELSGTAQISGSLRGREFDVPRYGFTRRYERREGRWQIVSCEFSFARLTLGR